MLSGNINERNEGNLVGAIHELPLPSACYLELNDIGVSETY
ncbi:hypothetical protein SBF1_1620006 [Candidatus Desulfosporosinus infrequens]|uniref:Uncharacterized protein n=1 Tax=Candidatus Desulfosporosinus infrequens TaxID=2043169 RepID=A0A2U3KA45_9FIRM|nr:hypothetical protein SBF1_1620006 [Candidatus Desulfosporosinus infrequens]